MARTLRCCSIGLVQPEQFSIISPSSPLISAGPGTSGGGASEGEVTTAPPGPNTCSNAESAAVLIGIVQAGQSPSSALAARGLPQFGRLGESHNGNPLGSNNAKGLTVNNERVVSGAVPGRKLGYGVAAQGRELQVGPPRHNLPGRVALAEPGVNPLLPRPPFRFVHGVKQGGEVLARTCSTANPNLCPFWRAWA
jgi:hypothetical protein